MNKLLWINTNIRTPELKPVMRGTWKESKCVPVRVSGVKGWYKGWLYASEDETYIEWKVDGFNILEGDRVVTHWLDIEVPESNIRGSG